MRSSFPARSYLGPLVAQATPTLVDLGPNLATTRPTSVECAIFWGRFRTTLGPTWPSFCPNRRFLPLRQHRLGTRQHLRVPDRIRLGLEQTRDEFDRRGPDALASIAPPLPTLVHVGPIYLVQSAPIWSQPPHPIWPKPPSLSAYSSPNIGQLVWSFWGCGRLVFRT